MNKLKLFAVVTGLCILSNGLYSENPKKKTSPLKAKSEGKCFDENSHILNLGIGIGGYNYYSAYSGSGYSHKVSPAFSLSYEQPLKKKVGPGFLGLGAYLGFQTASSTYNYYWYHNQYLGNYSYTYRWTNYLVSARAAYHPDVLNFSKGEIYGGLLIGLRIQNFKYETTNPDPYAYTYYNISSGSVYPSVTIFAGGRYYLTDNIGLFLEAGWGISYLTAGFSFKF